MWFSTNEQLRILRKSKAMLIVGNKWLHFPSHSHGGRSHIFESLLLVACCYHNGISPLCLEEHLFTLEWRLRSTRTNFSDAHAHSVSRITSLCLQDILLQRRTLHLFTKRPSLMLANIAHPKFNRKGESCWEEVVVLSGRNDVVGDTDVSRLVTTLRAWLPRQSDSSPLI